MNTRSRKNRAAVGTRSLTTKKSSNLATVKQDELKRKKEIRPVIAEASSRRLKTKFKNLNNSVGKKLEKVGRVSRVVTKDESRAMRISKRELETMSRSKSGRLLKRKFNKSANVAPAVKSRNVNRKVSKPAKSRITVRDSKKKNFVSQKSAESDHSGELKNPVDIHIQSATPEPPETFNIVFKRLENPENMDTVKPTEQQDKEPIKEEFDQPVEIFIESVEVGDLKTSSIMMKEQEEVEEVKEASSNDAREPRLELPELYSNNDLTEIQVITVEEITESRSGCQKPLYHECVYCDRKFLYYKNLRAHIRSKHIEIFDALYSRRTDTSDYIPCEYCTRKFKYRKNMRAHIRQKHPETVVNVSSDELLYECSLCTRKFKYKKNLVAHIRQKHWSQMESSLPEMMETYGPECKYCGAKFIYKKMLNAHIRSEHSENEPSRKSSGVGKDPGPFMCNDCSSVFIYKRNLNAHIRNKHYADQFGNMKHPLYKCAECDEPFHRVASLKKHIKRIHSMATVDGSSKTSSLTPKRCPLCSYHTMHRTVLLNHFADAHEIDVEVDYIQFDTMELFNRWKDELENETKCRYNKISFKMYADRSTAILQCHRSGHYRARGSGCRLLKAQGSKKLNAYCPAQLHVTDSNDGVQVRFTSTHVGHENELCHLYLKQRDREIIAQKLALGIPPEDIIAEAEDPEHSDRRASYINLKDIYNVKASFHLKLPDRVEKPELLSLEDWIEAHQPSVLFYVKKGSKMLPEMGMEDDDFMLILMDDLQKEMFCKFGGNIVCVQTIRNPNKYSFLLTTVMVLDEYCESFPVAFLFSNRINGHICKVFFHHVASVVGPIQPNVFMSDKGTELYEAWAETMLPAKRQLFCTWHVLRDWKNNAVKIHDEEKRKSIVKWLEDEVLKQVDYYSFEEALNTFLESTDQDVHDFLEYFVENYLETIPSWAYCFRLDAQINTNLSAEAFYRVLRYVNAKESSGPVSIETALHSLTVHMEYKKRCRKITSMKRFKHSKKIATIRRNHKNALNAKVDESSVTMIEDGWMIPSFTNVNEELCEMFVVRKNESLACVDCKLVCPSCNVCIHSYSCSCLDYSIRFTMCEHIHFLCIMLKTKVEFEEIEESTLELDEFDSDGSLVAPSTPVSASECESQSGDWKIVNELEFGKLLSKCHGSADAKEKKSSCESFKHLDLKVNSYRKDS